MKPFVLDARRTLVLLIDMQEKLMPAIAHREDIERMGSLLLRCADAMGVPVLVSEHYTKGLGKTVPSLVQALPEACPVVEKISFSCWGEPEIVRSVERAARRQFGEGVDAVLPHRLILHTPAREQIHVALHDGKRGTQLMRDIRNEASLLVIGV